LEGLNGLQVADELGVCLDELDVVQGEFQQLLLVALGVDEVVPHIESGASLGVGALTVVAVVHALPVRVAVVSTTTGKLHYLLGCYLLVDIATLDALALVAVAVVLVRREFLLVQEFIFIQGVDTHDLSLAERLIVKGD
jgi:hypothetical protein